MTRENNFVLGGHHLADGKTWVGPKEGLEAFHNEDGTVTVALGMSCDGYGWTFKPEQLDAFIAYLQTGKIDTIGQMGRIHKAADYVEPKPREPDHVINARYEAEGLPLRVRTVHVADLLAKGVGVFRS
ncbi:MAG: hypothetical protein AABZ76_07320 [Pseudomonadota bacterium]